MTDLIGIIVFAVVVVAYIIYCRKKDRRIEREIRVVMASLKSDHPRFRRRANGSQPMFSAYVPVNYGVSPTTRDRDKVLPAPAFLVHGGVNPVADPERK